MSRSCCGSGRKNPTEVDGAILIDDDVRSVEVDVADGINDSCFVQKEINWAAMMLALGDDDRLCTKQKRPISA